MSSLRHSAALRCVRTLPRTATTTSSSNSSLARSFSTTARRQAGSHDSHHNESPFDPPSGWLWGEKPGTKYEKEGWEGPVYYGFGAAFLLMVIGAAFKPDTSLDTWALEEARRRLEKEGILPDPFPDHVEPEDKPPANEKK